MRTFWKGYIVLMVVLIGIFFYVTCVAQSEENKPIQKLERPKAIDGVLFNPDGSFMWLDTYINVFRPGIQFWLDENAAMKHIKRIRCEANFLVVGSGKNRDEIESRVKNNESLEGFFRKAFCTEIENTDRNSKPICEKKCVGNPDDYIVLVVRMIPDSPMRNTNFLFSYISKQEAYDLGCRENDVVEYVEKKSGR